MIDFGEFVDSVLTESESDDTTGRQRALKFLIDNNWFGSKPLLIENKTYISDKDADIFRQPLLTFLSSSDEPDDTRIMELFKNKFPETAKYFYNFSQVRDLSKQNFFYICDFLLFHLKKDLFLMNDDQISNLVGAATDDLIKSHGDELTFFISWLKTEIRTNYRKEYVMKNRYSMNLSSQAYDFDEYLELMYYLFNDEYISANEMYLQAAQSKNYADTWLFLSIHFICALRFTDLERIHHPFLPKEPEDILQEISDGRFSDEDARSVILSITTRLRSLPLTPNKTSGRQNISEIKFIVPESCEVHMGTLFAICEAHWQLSELPSNTPLIRKISDYDRISRYMGDDIGSLFLESDFRSKSANKSYLQAINMLTDDILDNNPLELKVKGYHLAALARSHKGDYGKFAKTTATYLKDAQMDGLTPEFVARELFERGVLSFIPAMLLKMLTKGAYNALSAENQSMLIKELGMSPYEVEKTSSLVECGRIRSKRVVNELLTLQPSDEDVLEILHRIGNGEAFSKQSDSLCLLTASRKVCPFDDQRQCIGCKYEIKTKSTMFLLGAEYKRIRTLYEQAVSEKEKTKYLFLLKESVLPAFDEVLTVLRNMYGDAVFSVYEEVLRRVINE